MDEPVSKSNFKRIVLAVICGLCLPIVAPGGLVLAAPSKSGGASTIALTFGSKTPGSVSRMDLQITYAQPGDPAAKPPAVTSIEIRLPSGTGVNLHRLPTCEASDAIIEVLGDMACPPSSTVGSGSVSAVTGLGAPADPIVGHVRIFNASGGFIEVITTGGLSAPALDDRVTVDRDTLSAQVPAIPGGPPDFHTAVKDLSVTFPAADAYITTPATCPLSREWTTTATFAFADGTHQQASSATPCSIK